MCRPLLPWPSSGWIQFIIREAIYRYDIIWNKLLVEVRGNEISFYAKWVGVCADGKDQAYSMC